MNSYADAKIAMEHMARIFVQRVPLLVTKPSSYTGPGQAARFLVPKIVQHIHQRKGVIVLGNSRVRRGFSGVHDMVTICCRILNQWPTQAVSGSIIKVGSRDTCH